MIKVPFIESYLDQYNGDKEINKIIKNHSCKMISYSRINKNTMLDNYEYIIFFGIADLICWHKNKKNIYDNEKIIIVDEYNAIVNIQHYVCHYNLALNVNILSKNLNKKFFMSNLLKAISFTQKKYVEIIKIPMYFFNYISSSVTQINVKILKEFEKQFLCNLPNKIKIMNFEAFQKFKRVKYPNNVKKSIS